MLILIILSVIILFIEIVDRIYFYSSIAKTPIWTKMIKKIKRRTIYWLKIIASYPRNVYLCIRFPFLCPRNVYSGRPVRRIPRHTVLDNMPKGWRKAFGISLIKDIKQELLKYDFLYQYQVVDVKEKFGSLRWCDNGAPNTVFNIISKYEKLSYKTCIHCGKPAVGVSTGWISPYCQKHAQKFISEEQFNYFKNGNS